MRASARVRERERESAISWQKMQKSSDRRESGVNGKRAKFSSRSNKSRSGIPRGRPDMTNGKYPKTSVHSPAERRLGDPPKRNASPFFPLFSSGRENKSLNESFRREEAGRGSYFTASPSIRTHQD